MKNIVEALDYLPLILIFMAWVAMGLSFFLNFEIPISGGSLS